MGTKKDHEAEQNQQTPKKDFYQEGQHLIFKHQWYEQEGKEVL